MGVRGFLNYVIRHKDRGSTMIVDLVQEAHKNHNGLTLLVELGDFLSWFFPQVDAMTKEYDPDASYSVYGGEYAEHDEALTTLIFGLRNVGIYLDFFVDVPRGCGLADAVTTGAWADEARRRQTQALETAKAVRLWCRGERADLPERMDDSRLQPALWFDQARATLARCGSQIWHLNPDEQAPLLPMGRNSPWGHYWGVVSDNVDWAVVKGVKLIPLACFDMRGDVTPRPRDATAVMAWPEVASLAVGFTSADLLAEHLRLGHPPRDDDLREANGKGKGRGPVGCGNWPYKWWHEQVVMELAMLCGTDATTPYVNKLKLYQQLGIHIGQDPVDGITRWLRDQLYKNKLRWRDVQLEALSPVLAELLKKDTEFALALQCSRAVYTQNINELRTLQLDVAKLRQESSEKAIFSSYARGNTSPELPEATTPFIRSVVLANRVWLDVHFEDVTRNGAPLAHQLTSDLRRITYVLLRSDAVYEHAVAGDQRTGISCSRVDPDTSTCGIPGMQAILRWPYMHRWAMFRRIIEHNVLKTELAAAMAKDNADGEEPDCAKVSVERAVWDGFKEEQPATNDHVRALTGFAASVLEFFVSLNHHPGKPLIRDHEFDSVVSMVMLCYDASLPGAPAGDAPEHALQRFADAKANLLHLLAVNFPHSAELHIPVRVTTLGTWFQVVVRHLQDLVRLLSLDADGVGGQPMFVPEPRELYSGALLAGLYMGGAYDSWELNLPAGDSNYWWKGLLKQISQWRHEVVSSHYFQSWKRRLIHDMRWGTVVWPSREQLSQDQQKVAQVGEELPIDEHRDKILQHIEKHRVTCIQGETGCGKSTRVPVYIMEDYFERKRAGKLTDKDSFMVLCTQPRRIACISLANRVASCLKEKVGDSIGYKISGDSCVKPGRTKLVYVTTGYLLQVLVNNPEQIKNYTHLVLDEVHERDVDSDLLSLVIKLQMNGYDFKLAIMSATLQGDLFTRYFSEKKIKTIFVGVKRFPVEVIHVEQILERYGGRYADWDSGYPTGTRGLQMQFTSQAVRAVKEAERTFGTGGYEADPDDDYGRPQKGEFDDSSSDSGDSDEEDDDAAAAHVAVPKRRRREVHATIIRGMDVLVYEIVSRVAVPGEGILVFLPGLGEISELQETLLPLEDPDRRAHMTWEPSVHRPDVQFKVFVLHSLIPKDEQEGAVFDAPPEGVCHVILASNIAESSLTIPKIRVVIDFGLRRQLVYDKRRHMSALVTTWVSQASAKQRCGRTGRVFEGVNIRLFTKQFHDNYLDEFDPPEMQTAPLEKLYVNVKHLSSKLPEYQINATEKRRRTPKELLQLSAQPPELSSIESSIEVLDQLGALTGATEDAELTVLGYLMMSVPLDVHLCRLVIFSTLLGVPCDGVAIAAALSVQDPFTLPSHLIIKDPREYAEALKRSFETRQFFDHGHHSEPLMLRSLFVQWLGEFRKMLVERCKGGRTRRESARILYQRASAVMAQKFAVVPKRLVHLANAVVDTSQRMRKFIPPGAKVGKQLDSLLKLLQGGDHWFASAADADASLPKISELFSDSCWALKTLMIMSFTPSFLTGGTKVRIEEPMFADQGAAWKRKKKERSVQKKEKNKMEQLIDEIIDQGLNPATTVACVLELPRGRGAPQRWTERFEKDLRCTIEMMTCGEKFTMKMAGDNKALVCFDGESSSDPFQGVHVEPEAKLDEEACLVQDLPAGAHYIDLYGAGRFKFPVSLVNSLKLEREQAERDQAEKLKAAAKAEAGASKAEKGKKDKAKQPSGTERDRTKDKRDQAQEKADDAKCEAKQEATQEATQEAKQDAAQDTKHDARELTIGLDTGTSDNPTPTGAGAMSCTDVVPTRKEDPDVEGQAASADASASGVAASAPVVAETEATPIDLASSAAPAPEEVPPPKSSEARVPESEATASSVAPAPKLAVDVAEGPDSGAAPGILEPETDKSDTAPDAKGAQDDEAGEANNNSLSNSDVAVVATDVATPSVELQQVHEDNQSEDVTPDPVDDAATEALVAEEISAELVEGEAEDNVEEPIVASDQMDDSGPIVTFYKPVSPYEVHWEIVDDSCGVVDDARKGKLKKRRVMKGKCCWRNSVGFLGSCRVNEAEGLDPVPNDMYGIYTSMQGGDSKELSWVDGVTLLSADESNLVAFGLLVAFLRHHQDLQIEADLQDGRVHCMRGLGGLEYRLRDDQPLLVEDIAKINAVRESLSEAFYTKPAPVPSTVDADQEGINFTGTRGRRDDEPVPMIAEESRVKEALDDLIKALRGVPARMHTIDDETWQQRIVLRRPHLQFFDMHMMSKRNASQSSSAPASASEDGKPFRIFEPLVDLEGAKREAEQVQHEEDERRRQQEEEKRRRKEEEKRKRAEEKRQRKQEEQRAREEAAKAERAARAARKGAGKGKKIQEIAERQVHEGKGAGKKGQRDPLPDQVHPQMQAQPHQPFLPLQQQQPQQQQQQQQRQQQTQGEGRRQKAKQKKGGRAEELTQGGSSSSRSGQPHVHDVPGYPSWKQVWDATNERYYYWNIDTNTTQWEEPSVTMPSQQYGVQGYMPQMMFNAPMPRFAGTSISMSEGGGQYFQ